MSPKPVLLARSQLAIFYTGAADRAASATITGAAVRTARPIDRNRQPKPNASY
jgi:hypothetical protein